MSGFGFPFMVLSDGNIKVTGGDEAIRGRIIQILFTAPGERVHQPAFGCGLFNLVFEPNNDVLRTAVEFNIREALQKGMGDEIQVDTVIIDQEEEKLLVNIIYQKKIDLSSHFVRVHFK